MAEKEFVIVRQRVGPYVKIYVTDRRGFVEWCRDDSSNGIRKRCGPAMQRTSWEKLEYRFATFGYDGMHLQFTFSPENMPRDRRGVEKPWRNYLKALRRWRVKQGLSKDFPYIYRIEGLHDGPHLHVFLSRKDFPKIVVRKLWTLGESNATIWDWEKLVHAGGKGGYGWLATYFTKEDPEVGKHPWGCSRSLKQKIPLPDVRFSSTGQISIPKNAKRLPVGKHGPTPWGIFNYTRYLEFWD